MNAYAYAGVTAALMALSGAAGFGSAVYLRPLQPPQQQAATVPPPAAVPTIRTVSWFEAHDAERTAKIKACANSPGVARLGDPECDNAFWARDRINIQRFHDQAWKD